MNTIIEQVDLSKLADNARLLVRLAVHLGWVARNTASLGVHLVSPNHESEVTLPSNGQLNDRRRRAMLAKILRYGDQMKVSTTMMWMEDRRIVLEPGSPLIDLDSTSLSVIRKHAGTQQAAIEAPRPEPQQAAEQPEPPVEGPSTPKRVTVVSEAPWLARRGSSAETARAYESDAVIERKWSDGSTDYVCSWPGCGWSSAIPVSVARHYGGSKTHTVPAVGGPDIRTEPYEWTSRSAAKADRLAREMMGGLRDLYGDGEIQLSGEVLAKQLAEWMVKQREQRRESHESDGEPLTADQVLEKVRQLVDDGSYARRIEMERQAQARTTEVQQQLEEAQRLLERSEANCAQIVRTAQEGAVELEQAKARAQAAEDRWAALAELVQGEAQTKGATG